MNTFFKKSKKSFLGHSGPFCPNLGKNYLTSKKREFFCQFLNIPIIYHRAKNQKKLMNHYWEKHQTDGPTDRQTDGQADSGDFIEPSVGRGPISTKILVKLWTYCVDFNQSYQDHLYGLYIKHQKSVRLCWCHLRPSL